MMDLVTGLQTRRHEHRPKEESTEKLAAQKQTVVSVHRERRDGCAKLSETSERWTSLGTVDEFGTSHDERIMSAEEREEEKQSNGQMQREVL